MRSYITYKRQKNTFTRRRTKLCETKLIAESIFLYFQQDYTRMENELRTKTVVT